MDRWWEGVCRSGEMQGKKDLVSDCLDLTWLVGREELVMELSTL